MERETARRQSEIITSNIWNVKKCLQQGLLRREIEVDISRWQTLNHEALWKLHPCNFLWVVQGVSVFHKVIWHSNEVWSKPKLLYRKVPCVGNVVIFLNIKWWRYKCSPVTKKFGSELIVSIQLNVPNQGLYATSLIQPERIQQTKPLKQHQPYNCLVCLKQTKLMNRRLNSGLCCRSGLKVFYVLCCASGSRLESTATALNPSWLRLLSTAAVRENQTFLSHLCKPTGLETHITKTRTKKVWIGARKQHRDADSEPEFMYLWWHYFSPDNEDALSSAEPINPL